MAQGDMRALNVAASATTGESGQELQKRLVIELGTIQVLEETGPLYEKRDQAAFDQLKTMQ